MDWDNDGKKDLLTGEKYGYIRIYLNTGTDANPQFSGYTYLQLGGSRFDCGNYSTPYVVDWNSDGKKDVICGEDTGKVYLLINTGTDANPVFTTSSYVKNGAGDLDVGSRGSPVAVDWDRDGKKDLVIGEYQGYIYFYDNKGTDTNPSFNGRTQLKAGGVNLDVYYYARIDVADWDNDGILDIISGNRNYNGTPTGGVWYFHAMGPLSIDANALSQSQGGTVNFDLNAGTAYAGRQYFLLGTKSGTEPGTTLPGGNTLPLNNDVVLQYIVSHYNNAIFPNFRGTLDAGGGAAAAFNAPASLPLALGTIMNFAYTTENPYDYQSNPVSVEIVN